MAIRETNSRNGILPTVEWPTIALILFCYSSWFVAGFWIWPAYPALALAVMSVTVALQSSLMHEVLHGHPTRNGRLNEAFVCLPIGLVWPYRRFRALHLRHHRDERLTDPFDDPESFYQAQWKHRRMPMIVRCVLRLNNVMLLRLVLGPVLGVAGLIWTDINSIMAGSRRVLIAWALHVFWSIPILGLIVAAFDIPVWLYMAVPVWIGHGIISIRTYAEHQWSEAPECRTIIVERSLLGILFLNNNLHAVHHARPNVAWYRLPALYRADRSEWRKKNGGYVFPNYLSLLARHALKAKEPVVHPAWRRDIERQFFFLPESHGQSGLQSANVRSAATPQKD